MRDFLEQHVPRVYGFALRLTNDTHLAEDLTQEAFLRAWSRRTKLRQPEAARVWLFRITVNLWRDHVRHGRVRGARPAPLPPMETSRDLPPELLVSQQDDLRCVMEALVDLPERQREVLQKNLDPRDSLPE